MNTLLANGLLAFAAGILLNFTPCVLPVIPLKIRALLREIEGTGRSRLLAACALLAGTLSLFLAAGAMSAYLGWRWGEFFQSKPFLIALSAFLFLAGVAMFSQRALPLPQVLYRLPLHRYLGAFLTGVLAGILSTPCAGPFLGGVLAYALTQPPTVVLALFSAIGAGLAFPYGLMLAFPRFLNFVPRIGPVGIQVKSLLGFVLIAGALFFAGAFLSGSVQTLLWWGFALALCSWAFIAAIRCRTWVERGLPLLVMTTLLGLSTVAVTGGDNVQLHWRPYSAAAFQQARQTQRPVLIEFTADWCLNCKVLERTVYVSPLVTEAARKVDLMVLRVDMTDFTEGQKSLLETYGGTALPYAVVTDRKGRTVRTFSGMFTPQAMQRALLD